MSVKNYSTHRMLEYMQTLYCAKKNGWQRVDNRRKNRINIRDQKKPLTALVKGFFFGANGENRTHDLFITSELLYRLSYIGDVL